MKPIKIRLFSILVVAACFVIPMRLAAQWRIGASYEHRNDDPNTGFGIQLKRQILNPVPIIDVGLRVHFSYFNDDNAGGTEGAEGVTYYDYGLDATGGVSLGLFKPYIGIGLGADHYNVESRDEETGFFWNSFVGAKLTPIPILHPYIEYRFVPSDSPDFAKNFNSHGRLVLGLTLAF